MSDIEVNAKNSPSDTRIETTLEGFQSAVSAANAEIRKAAKQGQDKSVTVNYDEDGEEGPKLPTQRHYVTSSPGPVIVPPNDASYYLNEIDFQDENQNGFVEKSEYRETLYTVNNDSPLLSNKESNEFPADGRKTGSQEIRLIQYYESVDKSAPDGTIVEDRERAVYLGDDTTPETQVNTHQQIASNGSTYNRVSVSTPNEWGGTPVKTTTDEHIYNDAEGNQIGYDQWVTEFNGSFPHVTEVVEDSTSVREYRLMDTQADLVSDPEADSFFGRGTEKIAREVFGMRRDK